MLIKTLYETSNGRQFDNLEDAIAYEKVLNEVIFFEEACAIGNKVYLKPSNLDNEYAVECGFEIAMAIYLPTPTHAKALNRILNLPENINSLPDIRVPNDARGIWYYIENEEEEETLVDINSLIDNEDSGYKKVRDKIISYICKKELQKDKIVYVLPKESCFARVKQFKLILGESFNV